MIRKIRQWWCGRHGHPYPMTTVPIVGQHPGDPEHDVDFCTNCGTAVAATYTDDAGSERRTLA